MDNTNPFSLIDLGDDDLSGEIMNAVTPPAGTEIRRQRASTEPVCKLDLNTATLEELEALPGVGPLRARRILAWRERNGDFDSLDELRYVRGLGARSVMELTPYLMVRERS